VEEKGDSRHPRRFELIHALFYLPYWHTDITSNDLKIAKEAVVGK
jgi:hypothetical protein